MSLGRSTTALLRLTMAIEPLLLYTKVAGRFAAQQALEVVGQVVGVLLGHGREHGQALGHVLGHHVGHVADGEDVGLALHLVPTVHRDALVAGHGLGGQAGHFGPVHAGRPHQVFGRNKLRIGVIGLAILVALDGVLRRTSTPSSSM